MARKRTLFQHQLPTVLITLAGITLASDLANGQIVPDDSLGVESSTVRQDVIKDLDSDVIEGGATRGANLFHSFSEFNVDEGRGAYFANPDAIDNILSRVTGSNLSEILGTLGVLGDANLFLLNPNGIIFGENARLDLNGSFFASTADSLLFDNEFEFSAKNSQATPLLTVNIPIGLGFRDNPEEIVNKSFVQNNVGDFVGLEVAPGENLTLVGGNINFDSGEATARDGRIELGGLSAAGTVIFNDDGSLSFPEDVAKADIFLNGFADVDVRGTGSGNITINARNLNLEDFSSIRAGITADSTSADSQAGDITINATDSISIDYSDIQNLVASGAVGNGGNVFITTGSLEVTNDAQLRVNTLGKGDAGNMVIKATDWVKFDGGDFSDTFSGALSEVASGAIGNAGDISITAKSLEVTNGARIGVSTFGEGNAGSITIKTSDTVKLDGKEGYLTGAFSDVQPETMGKGGIVSITTGALEVTNGSLVRALTRAEGDAGSIIINTDSLEVTNGGLLLANTTFGKGNAGNIIINATDWVKFDGEGDFSGSFSGALSEVELGAMGNAGGISITAKSLEVTNGARIGVSTFGEGNAGNVTIKTTDWVRFDRQEGGLTGAFSDVQPGTIGNGGNVSITTSFLEVTNGSLVHALTRAEGDAGSVIINTDSLKVSNGAQIRADTRAEGDAGSVIIHATDSVKFDGDFSGAFTEVIKPEAVGNAGNVSITSESLEVTNGARIGASTFGEGNAGSITINADTLKATGDSRIQTSTESIGNAGDITLNLRDSLNLSGSTIEAKTTSESSGNGGNITIDPVLIKLNDNSAITVNSEGTGDSGSIELTADNLTLKNNSEITAATASGEGGNIELAISDILLLENNSSVTTKAEGTGKGGNIKIDADFTILKESNIIADAFEGAGGNINITTQGLFERNSKIDASSEKGVDGVVQTNTPEIDPSQGLVELPENVQDPNKLIAQNACKQGTGSSLIVTGRGGLPPSSSQNFNSNWVDVDLIQPILPEEQSQSASNKEPNSISSSDASSQNKFVPAEGWVVNEKGEIFLVAYKSSNTNTHRQNNLDRCQPR